MKCPHCTVEIHFDPEIMELERDSEGDWGVSYQICPSCEKLIVFLVIGEYKMKQGAEGEYSVGFESIHTNIMVRPHSSSRPPCPPEVPLEIAQDYLEACKTLADSPKASAALSRRCLQNLLREYLKVKPSELANEIQEVIDGGKLPTEITEEIDAIRHIGNFAALPMKSKNSKEILDVEPAEAEWNLEVLESLFDWIFVQPERRKRRRDELNAKLADAGKPPLKSSVPTSKSGKSI